MEAYREPNDTDRPCDTCGVPMVGIMRVSHPPVRITCDPCGGKASQYWNEDNTDRDVKNV